MSCRDSSLFQEDVYYLPAQLFAGKFCCFTNVLLSLVAVTLKHLVHSTEMERFSLRQSATVFNGKLQIPSARQICRCRWVISRQG